MTISRRGGGAIELELENAEGAVEKRPAERLDDWSNRAAAAIGRQSIEAIPRIKTSSRQLSADGVHLAKACEESPGAQAAHRHVGHVGSGDDAASIGYRAGLEERLRQDRHRVCRACGEGGGERECAVGAHVEAVAAVVLQRD